MEPIDVHKFGGGSLANAGRIHGIAGLIREAAGSGRIIVVATAMAGVTDRLDVAAKLAAEGDRKGSLEELSGLIAAHLEILSGTGGDRAEGARGEIEAISRELTDLVNGVALLAQLTPRTRDRMLAAGEKMAARLLADSLSAGGSPARVLDPDDFLETDDRFGEASPQTSVADRTIRATLQPVLDSGAIPVLAGFCGRAPDGATTTLGRGGADLTATFVAAAVGAREVTLWSDIEGVFNADPEVVPGARVIPRLNYREAAEMSFYGAKLLHPRSMIPVAPAAIPVRVRSSLAADRFGTVVDGRFASGEHPVKAVSAIREHGLISVEGKGMAGVPGIAARVFGVLASRRISVTMISQSSSESTICLAVPSTCTVDAEAALKGEFQLDMARGLVEEIVAHRRIGLVAVVGLGMANTPGVAGRVFSALGRAGINVLAIAQGTAELNISLAVNGARVEDAVRVLHEEFELHRPDAGTAEEGGGEP